MRDNIPVHEAPLILGGLGKFIEIDTLKFKDYQEKKEEKRFEDK